MWPTWRTLASFLKLRAVIAYLNIIEFWISPVFIDLSFRYARCPLGLVASVCVSLRHTWCYWTAYTPCVLRAFQWENNISDMWHACDIFTPTPFGSFVLIGAITENCYTARYRIEVRTKHHREMVCKPVTVWLARSLHRIIPSGVRRCSVFGRPSLFLLRSRPTNFYRRRL